VSPLKIKIPSKNMREKPTYTNYSFSLLIMYSPQLSVFHKALETLPEDGKIMPKHVGATIPN
jgi:hypothetical protein